MTAACCRMPVVARCSQIPMNCGICSYCAHTANWVTEASQSPVSVCGTTFHQDYDGWDCHLTLSNNLWKLTCLATEAHSDSIEFICGIKKTLVYVCMYVCMYVYSVRSTVVLHYRGLRTDVDVVCLCIVRDSMHLYRCNRLGCVCTATSQVVWGVWSSGEGGQVCVPQELGHHWFGECLILLLSFIWTSFGWWLILLG